MKTYLAIGVPPIKWLQIVHHLSNRVIRKIDPVKTLQCFFHVFLSLAWQIIKDTNKLIDSYQVREWLRSLETQLSRILFQQFLCQRLKMTGWCLGGLNRDCHRRHGRLYIEMILNPNHLPHSSKYWLYNQSYLLPKRSAQWPQITFDAFIAKYLVIAYSRETSGSSWKISF